MNYNRDYMVVDNLKPLFGLNQIKMKRIIIDKVSKKMDKDKKNWINNSKWINKQGTVYTLMRQINGHELITQKNKIKGNILRELVKIGLYRGIFRVSDYNLKNIFITPENKLYSIDEHNIGKRVRIFNKTFTFKKLITKSLLDEILTDLNMNKLEKINQIKKQMIKYDFSEKLINKVISQYNNLKKDAYIELGFN